MPYPTAILFTLALFTAGMAAIGWWQDASAPAFTDWLFAKVIEGGLWSGFVLFLAMVGFFTWRGSHAGKGTG